jgi:hypothetical protein
MERNKQWMRRMGWALGGLTLGGLVGAVVLAVVLAGCGLVKGEDGCAAETLRCQGARLEVCDADHTWVLVVDCAVVTPGIWSCCPMDGTCMPDTACGGSTEPAGGDAGDVDR